MDEDAVPGGVVSAGGVRRGDRGDESAGLSLFVFYAHGDPALAGLGTLAYTFGLRHAFDADHIAAIDNTTRKLLQDGQRPLGVGFFFSLGHSTIVFGLVAGVAIAARTVSSRIPAFQDYGGYIGATVSGTFLWIIGILNLLVLIDIVRIFFAMRTGACDQEQLESRLLDRGFMNRFYLGRLAKRIDASWKMYPLGVLFGLGFDPATEVGLLAISAGVATHHVSFLAVLSLPILFAAGMCLMDTADGAFMSQAYGWAFSNPIRKVYYNITVTTLSVTVALLVGSIELLQVLSAKAPPQRRLLGLARQPRLRPHRLRHRRRLRRHRAVSILVWKKVGSKTGGGAWWRRDESGRPPGVSAGRRFVGGPARGRASPGHHEHDHLAAFGDFGESLGFRIAMRKTACVPNSCAKNPAYRSATGKPRNRGAFPFRGTRFGLWRPTAFRGGAMPD